MKNNSEYQWDVYESTPPMPTYVLAIAVFFNHASTGKDITNKINKTTTIGAWISSDDSKNVNITRVVERTADIINFYEEFFDKENILPKIDSLEIWGNDDQFGGMEHWGLTTYYKRENPEYWPPLIVKKFIHDGMNNFQVLTHECAHYWIGNSVTCRNWNE